MYALCVSGTANIQGFVWKFSFALIKKIHSFIHTGEFRGEGLLSASS